MFLSKHSYDIEPVMPPLAAEFIQSVLHPISVEPFYDSELVMSSLVAEFENWTHNLSIQSVLHLISAKRDVPWLNHNESEGTKMGPKDEGVRASKKQKIR
jgi:hypothetical protein